MLEARLGKTLKLVALVSFLMNLSACGGGGDLLVGYLIYDQLIKKDGNSGIWSGQVRDTLGTPLEGYVVSITVDRPEPEDDITRTGVTGEDGTYRIIVPWYENALYSASVSLQGTVLVRQEIGLVAKKDHDLDFEIPSALSNVTVSGKAVDSAGRELSQVFVSVAKPESIGGDPNYLITDISDSQERVRFVVTNASGAFLFEKVYGMPLLIVGFSPSQGFGYLFVEQPTDISAGGDLVMPGAESSLVRVKVLDETGNPMGNRVLLESERFNLVLSPAYDLSEQVAQAVTQAGIYGGISGQEILAVHPSERTLEVRSTGIEGISDQSASVTGGLYKLGLLKPDGGEYEGAILGENPRIIFGGSETLIQVKIRTD